jgi:hypothetical protein
VATLARAVPLLGTKPVLSLALSFSLVRERRRESSPGFDRPSFWRRAVFSALASRTLAEGSERTVDPEEAFVAALLQDLGMLALAEVFPRDYGILHERAGGDHLTLAALERDALGADHSHVSSLLARNWRLPLFLERAIRASHAAPPEDAPAAERALGTCVALSGPLADVWVAPGNGETLSEALATATERLDVPPAVTEAVLSRMALAVPETSSDFDIDLGGVAAVEAVLAEARATLDRLDLAPSPLATRPVYEEGGPLEGALRFAFECARKRREPLTLLLVSLGPLPSDDAPRLLSTVRDCTRSVDLIGLAQRGDVMVLLPDSDIHDGRVTAERLLYRAAAQHGFKLSIGVAASGPPAPSADLGQLQAIVTRAADAARARGGGVVATGGDGYPGRRA